MKPMRLHETLLVVAGILIGFALGIYIYQAFFLLRGDARNGIATFIAIICSLVGTVTMIVVRAEARGANSENGKPDA